MAGRQLDEKITLGQEEYFTAYDKCAYPLTDKDFERRFDLAGITGIQNRQVRTESACRVLYGCSFSLSLGDVGWAASFVPLRPTLEPYHTAGAVVHHGKFRWLMSDLLPKADIG